MKLHIENVIEQLIGKHKNKNIINHIEVLRESTTFNSFLNNNDFSFKSWELHLTVNDMFLRLIDERVEESLILNMFDESTLMFIMLSLNEQTDAWKKKFRNYVFDILVNSHKFNVYKNTPKTVRKIIDKQSYTMEFFWLIPLFANNKLLHNMIDDWKDICGDFEKASKENPAIKELVIEINSSNVTDESNIEKIRQLMGMLS